MAGYKDTYNSGAKIRVNSIHKQTVGSSPLGKGLPSGSNDNDKGPSPFFSSQDFHKVLRKGLA